MIRLSVESKLLAMLLFVSIASILAITFITYTAARHADDGSGGGVPGVAGKRVGAVARLPSRPFLAKCFGESTIENDERPLLGTAPRSLSD